MPFAKGKSGNYRGRPKKDYILTERCQAFTAEAVDFMVRVMRGEEIRKVLRRTKRGREATYSEAPLIGDRIRAAEWLVDRGWGKAPVVLAGPGGVGPAEITMRWEEPPPRG